MLPLYAIFFILHSIIQFNGVTSDPFCSGTNYIQFDNTLKPDLHGTYGGLITSEEVEFHFYSPTDSSTYLDVVIYYRKDSYFVQMHAARMCCNLSKDKLDNVVRRLNRDTLVYKLELTCYQVSYGFSVISGVYIIQSGAISCGDLDICKQEISPPQPVFVPHSAALSGTSSYAGTDARFQELTPTSALTDSPGTASNQFHAPLTSGQLTSTHSRFLTPTSTSSQTDQSSYNNQVLPPIVSQPMSSVNPLVQFGSDDFCKGIKNYIELDSSASFDRYKDSTSWGNFKLTLYSSPQYDANILGLEIKYLPDDFYDSREILLGKYKVCCDISIGTLKNALRLQAPSTLVFKLNEHGSQGALCRMITYMYVSSHGANRGLRPAEPVKKSCLDSSFCHTDFN